MRHLKFCSLLLFLCAWTNIYSQHRNYSGLVTEADGTPSDRCNCTGEE